MVSTRSVTLFKLSFDSTATGFSYVPAITAAAAANLADLPLVGLAFHVNQEIWPIQSDADGHKLPA